MKQIIQKYICLFALLFCASATNAQEKSYLESLLEASLSSPTLQTEIIGLTGTFSSSANVEMIKFSDSAGVWLTLKNVQLDWNRSALLSGKVDIQTLSASRINLMRKPTQTDSTITAQATPFRLPELPVSVQVEQINTDELILGAAVLGTEMRFGIDGHIDITDATLDTNINARDLETTGQFTLTAVFDDEERNLKLSLIAKEPENGLIVNLLNIPNKPALDISVSGNGPLSDFTSTLLIATNGTDRLNGQVKLQPNMIPNGTDGLQVSADITGDLAPLFAQQYKPFFGPANSLSAFAIWHANNEIDIKTFDLQTNALTAKGELQLAADYTPTLIEVSAKLQQPDNAPVLLPITGPETFVQSAQITLDYDITTPWYMKMDVINLTRSGMKIDSAKFQGFGEIPQPFTIKKTSDLVLSADLETVMSGLSFDDPKLEAAIGNDLRTTAQFVLRKDQPAKVSELTLTDGNIDANFIGLIDGFETSLASSGTARAQISNITPIAKLFNQTLSGQISVTAQGTVELLTGAFETDITSQASSIAMGNPTLNTLLRGNNTAQISVKRTIDGLFINRADFDNPQASASMAGEINSGGASFTLNSLIKNARFLSESLSGPLQLNGTVNQSENALLLDINTTGIAGTRADVSGSIPLSGNAWNVVATGQAPLAFLDTQLASSGAKIRGNSIFSLTLNGPPTLQNVSGTVSTRNANIALPDQGLSVNDLNFTSNLLRGNATVDTTGTLSTGGTFRADGTVNLDIQRGLPATLNIDISDARYQDQNFYKTRMNGDLVLSGALLTAPLLSGRIDLSETDVNIKETPSPTLSFVPNIIHKNETTASRETRLRANLIGSETSKTSAGLPINLDILVNAPERIFVRGRGLDAELGGQLRLKGTTQSVTPIGTFNLIRGRLNILGKRLALSEGSITLAGSLDPSIRIIATRSSSDYDASIVISGLVSDPQFTFTSSPALPEDEILVRLFFDRSLSELSPFQALQLAAAIQNLTGKGGSGFIERLRGKLGVDDFSVNTTEDGNTAVQAGKYISDNVYTDISIGQNGQSKVSINLDINKNISVTGTLKQSGESKLGVFFTKDY